uniref:Bm446 n=1 Tax=Brugia malayi TaxID=6279 RepID=A0A0H5S6C9_BRUMA|nr:Bm446 [Brugia malayi]
MIISSKREANFEIFWYDILFDAMKIPTNDGKKKNYELLLTGMEMHTFPDPAFKKKSNKKRRQPFFSNFTDYYHIFSSVDSGFVDSNYSGISPNMTKCKCGCHEGKQCTCKECPDKSAGKSKCVGSCHGGSTGCHDG